MYIRFKEVDTAEVGGQIDNKHVDTDHEDDPKSLISIRN